MYDLGVAHGVQFLDPVEGQVVLDGSLADQGDVAQRRIAVLGEPVGDETEGAEPVAVAILHVEPDRIVAPARDALGRMQPDHVPTGHAVEDAPDFLARSGHDVGRGGPFRAAGRGD